MAKRLQFPEGFLWGSATSAHQVEGGNHNSWSVWEKRNAHQLAKQAKTYWEPWQKIQFPEMFDPKNYISGTAADHYHLFEKDFDIAKELGHNSHRFSVEWSRIEPQEGVFDEKEIEHYRDVLKTLHKQGLKPFVTLWHWTDPLWIAQQGGWENKKTVEHFLQYVQKIVESFTGEEIPVWMPLNEPGTFIGMSYIQGAFPPNIRNLFRANRAYRNLMKAYREAYRIIHSKHPSALVGISHYASYMEPYKNKFFNRLITPILDYVRNWRFLDSVNDTNDFIGIQYYHRDNIDLMFRGGGKWGIINTKNLHLWINDLNWDMYPEGIYTLLMRAAKYKKPIYITENGLPDKSDDKRALFIKQNLYWIHKAIENGAPVKGYFYWSLLDNFEWDKGFWPRFGLVGIDYKTLKRTIRPSAYEYKRICEENAVEL